MHDGESSHSDPNLSVESTRNETSLTLCCGGKKCPTVSVVEVDTFTGAPYSIHLEDEGKTISMGRDQAKMLRDWLNTHFPA